MLAVDRPLRALPLVIGILPIVTLNLCYWISVEAERIPACLPYLDGCTSVSAAGRYPPANYLFRAVVLPHASLLAIYWMLAWGWLRLLEPERRRVHRAVLNLGVVGSLFLILYAVTLGTQGAAYELMRRYGVYVYFAFTSVAQLLLALRLRAAARGLPAGPLAGIATAKLGLCAAMAALGAANFIVGALLEESDNAENVIEWNYAMIMQAYFVLSFFAWRATGFGAALRTGVRPA